MAAEIRRLLLCPLSFSFLVGDPGLSNDDRVLNFELFVLYSIFQICWYQYVLYLVEGQICNTLCCCTSPTNICSILLPNSESLLDLCRVFYAVMGISFQFI